MLDARGQRISLGDRVLVWHGRTGEVVCSFDDREFGLGFPEAEWAHLERGALIKLDDGDLLHYEKADEDLRKIVIMDKAMFRSV